MDTIAYQKKILVIMIVVSTLIFISQIGGSVDFDDFKMMIKPQVKTIITGNATVNSPSYVEDGYVMFDSYSGTYTRLLTGTSMTIGTVSSTQTFRSFVWWNLNGLGIPENATVTKAVFIYQGYQHITGYDAHVHDLQYSPILIDANIVYSDIGNGDVYADVDGFVVVGTQKQLELNSLARDRIMYNYNGYFNPYFAIGMQLDVEGVTGKYNRIRSEEYVGVNPIPTLYLEYQYEVPDLEPPEPSPEECVVIFCFIVFILWFGLGIGAI